MVLKCMMILVDAEPHKFVISVIPSVAWGSLFTLFHAHWHNMFFDFEAVTCSLGDRTDQKTESKSCISAEVGNWNAWLQRFEKATCCKPFLCGVDVCFFHLSWHNLNSLKGWFVGNPRLIVNLSKISKTILYVEEGYVTDNLKNKQFGGRGSTYGLVPLNLYQVFIFSPSV